MWNFQNPVRIVFGEGSFETVANALPGGNYAIVTYDLPLFDELVDRLAVKAGAPALVIRDVAPNPDCGLLENQSARFAGVGRLDAIVAIGGGSVIDSAKVFAAAGGDFEIVKRFLVTGDGAASLSATPLVAVPTTAGTGSEVTSWATVWDEIAQKKYSLNRPNLYPTHAFVDPVLMLGKPADLTMSTGLDALSHALESIWNISANPVSARFAVSAAREILRTLPELCRNPSDLGLRTRMAQAALFAGLAFSNTKTALAHSLSYPLTLRYGVQHGIACSFSLPMILRSIVDAAGLTGDALREIFGQDLAAGADRLSAFLEELGVSTDPRAHGASAETWDKLVMDAFEGERGRNFIGSRDAFMRVSQASMRHAQEWAKDRNQQSKTLVEATS